MTDFEERLRLRAERDAVERVRDRAVEAVVGGRVIRQRLNAYGRCSAASARFWTETKRKDQWADLAGMPAAPDGWGKGYCEFTWSWRVFDSMDSESCGSSDVVVTDLDSEQQRCADHLAEVLELDNPYLVREYPIKLLFKQMRGATS